MRRIAIPVALIAVIGLLATPVAAAGHGADRPFKASFEGTARWEFPGTNPPACTEVTTITSAVGQVAHLGRVRLSSWHCPGEPDYVMDGQTVIVAANGDRLTGRYDYDPFDESNEIVFHFNGGTGRFAHAEGSALWTYQVIPILAPGCNDPDDFACLDLSVPWPWSSTLVGTISY